MNVLATVDTWFLVICVCALGGFFVWAMQYILSGLKQSVDKLDGSFQKSSDKMEKLINDLFCHRNDHETRLSVLENRCEIQHGDK